MDYVDVDDRNELPAIPPGFRWLDFIGGRRELRCFLVPEDMPRNRFIAEHEHLLEPCLAPIYHRDGIEVRQDATYALPGFYIVSLTQHFAALDLIPPHLFSHLSCTMQAARSAMRQVLGIQYVHLHYEEKPSPSCNVHIWLLPVPGDQPIMRLDLRRYLRSFRYTMHRNTIVDYNKRMRDALA